MSDIHSPTEIKAYFRDQGKYVLTFLGFSGAGYEDPDALLRIAETVLAERKPENTIVNIGATPDGIGAVYPLAKKKGFHTTGIVSSQALESDVALSPDADRCFYVEDPTWGGKMPGSDQLSPTSQLMVEVSDEMVAIGGGAVARDEISGAKEAGKKTRFFALDLNHDLAVEKARKKGAPQPNDFKGEAEKAEED